MTGALFDPPPVPPGRPGPLHRLLRARLDTAKRDGHDLAEDLALVVLSLADRIDQANAGGQSRGFVMLCSEFRAARRDLLEGLDDGGADPIEAALAEFRASEARNAADAGPGH